MSKLANSFGTGWSTTEANILVSKSLGCTLTLTHSIMACAPSNFHAESEKVLPLPEIFISTSEQKRPRINFDEESYLESAGYFPLALGAKLWNNNVAEYVVLRKLGWGRDSSVWMAREWYIFHRTS